MSGAGRPGADPVDAAGLSLAIAATRWHAEITDALVERAVAAAKACGVDDPTVIRVPGAAELAVVAALDTALTLRSLREPGARDGAPGGAGRPRH